VTDIVCVVCGQDYLRWYRNVRTDERFLLCPEEDGVWLPGEDTTQWPKQWLNDLFLDPPLLPGEVDWDFIEPAEPAA
jgi:hypothetical protein